MSRLPENRWDRAALLLLLLVAILIGVTYDDYGASWDESLWSGYGQSILRFWISFGTGAACVGAAGTLITPFFPVDPHVGNLFVLTAFVVVVLITKGIPFPSGCSKGTTPHTPGAFCTL